MLDACASARPNTKSFHFTLITLSDWCLHLAHTGNTAWSVQAYWKTHTVPPAYWKMDVAPPAVTSRHSNLLLLNADLKILLKADSASINDSEAQLQYNSNL